MKFLAILVMLVIFLAPTTTFAQQIVYQFINKIVDYPNLLPYNNIVSNHPATHSYSLQSTEEIVIYIESPNGNAGYSYPETHVSITGLLIGDGIYSGFYYQPESGVATNFDVSITNGKAKLLVPRFNDDLAIYIH